MIRQSITATFVLGLTTILEAVRNRILLVGLLFGVVLVTMSITAASIALWERERLIIDVGLAAASGLGALVSAALMISTFAGELRKRTVYAVLVRPLPRWAFVLGKYLGVVAAMQAVTTIMIVMTAGTVIGYGGDLSTAFWQSLWLNCVEVAVVCAVALLFSTMATPVLAATYTAGAIVAGNLADEMRRLAEHAEATGDHTKAQLLEAFYYVLPDLNSLSVRSQAANALDVPAGYMLSSTTYGLTYSAMLVVAAMWIFSRRKAI